MDLAAHGPWPPKPHEHLAIKMQSGWAIGEMIKLETPTSIILHLFKPFKITGYEHFNLWKDTDSDEIVVEKASVLPARPQIDLVPSLCTMTRSRRNIIYQLENHKMIQSIATA